jgi:hypothetical protein
VMACEAPWLFMTVMTLTVDCKWSESLLVFITDPMPLGTILTMVRKDFEAHFMSGVNPDI